MTWGIMPSSFHISIMKYEFNLNKIFNSLKITHEGILHIYRYIHYERTDSTIRVVF